METIDLKKIKGDNEVSKEVIEVYEYLKIFREDQARKDWMERKKKNWDAVGKNEMWDDKEKEELKKAGMTDLVVNKCNKGVQGSSAIVTDQKPEVKFFPVGSGDLYDAELLKRAHDLVWHKNSGNDVVYDTVEESKVGALGWIEINYNSSRGMFGRIEIDITDSEDIYFSNERKKRDFSDTHIIKARLRTKTYIKQNYDGITDADLEFHKQAGPDATKSSGVEGEDNYTISGDETSPGPAMKEAKTIWEIEAYFLRKVKRAVVVYVPEGQNDPRVKKYAIDGRKDEELNAAIKEDLGSGVKIVEISQKKVEVRIQRTVVGKKQIGADKENPLGEDADGDPVMPLIPLPHSKSGDGYASCPTDFALPVNKEKNKRRAQFIYAASQNINAPIVEPQGQVKWTGNPGSPGTRAEVSKNAAFQPTRLMSGGLDIGRFFDLEAVADSDIDDQYDMHDVMKGKMPKGDPSGRTVLALQDMGGMMSKPYLRKVESLIEKIGKVDISLCLKYWPRFMWERLIEKDEWMGWTPDGKLNPEDFEGKDEELVQAVKEIGKSWENALERIRPKDPKKPPGYTLIDLDVRVTAGSSLPTNRIARGAMAMDYVKNGIYDAEAALDYIDDPNKDKIKIRMKQKEEQMMQAGLQKKGA